MADTIYGSERVSIRRRLFTRKCAHLPAAAYAVFDRNGPTVSGVDMLRDNSWRSIERASHCKGNNDANWLLRVRLRERPLGSDVQQSCCGKC